MSIAAQILLATALICGFAIVRQITGSLIARSRARTARNSAACHTLDCTTACHRHPATPQQTHNFKNH